MMSNIYNRVGQAFDAEDYNKVIELIEEALKISDFGFNMPLLYKYGYSLLKLNRIEEGLAIFKIIVKNDTKKNAVATIKLILNKWENKKEIKLPEHKYLKDRYPLEPGVAVYLKSDCEVTSENPNHQNMPYYNYLIWKIEGNTVYAFALEKRGNFGYGLEPIKYFKPLVLTANPSLVTFDLSSISKTDIKLDPLDYNWIIQDLYERYCILGTIHNLPKNLFVQEIEKKSSFSVGDIIAMYDINSRVRRYYYIIDINQDQYKGVAITHSNGEISLRSEEIVEIPSESYIMEKLEVSPENQTKLQEITANLLVHRG